jgi:hypothetical protein
MREGIYRLYRQYIDDHGRVQHRLVSRFVFYGQALHGLEDHDGILESLAPEGRVDASTLARLESIERSPYWELVHEDEVQAGEHEHLLPEVDAGPTAWPAGEQ